MTIYKKAPFGVVFNKNIRKVVRIDNRPVYFKPWTDVLKLDFLKTVT